MFKFNRLVSCENTFESSVVNVLDSNSKYCKLVKPLKVHASIWDMPWLFKNRKIWVVMSGPINSSRLARQRVGNVPLLCLQKRRSVKSFYRTSKFQKQNKYAYSSKDTWCLSLSSVVVLWSLDLLFFFCDKLDKYFRFRYEWRFIRADICFIFTICNLLSKLF